MGNEKFREQIDAMTSSYTRMLDLVEAATGTRKLVLTVPEFAQLTGRDYDEIRKRAGQDIPAERDGDRGRWRIPIQALKPFLEGRCAA